VERRRKRKKKKLPRPFLLNLPLIVADFVSCGFTVTVRYVLKKKEQPFLALSLKWNKRPQKMRVSLHVGFMAACAGIPSPRWSTGLVLMAPAPVPSTALTSQRICWKTHAHGQAYAHTAASFTVPSSPLPHPTTKCLPITVLHICMPPRLPQRTKQPYAKQSGIPTYIAMRRTV